MARAADGAPAAGFSADVAVAAALLLAALMGLLWWRFRVARDDRDARRRRSARSRAASHGDPGPAQRPLQGTAPAISSARSAVVQGAGSGAPHDATPAAGPSSPVPPHALADGIDLIQQAEFLSLLGERDAAVALLGAHLEGAGGGDAAVWLKLMQVHRRFGDRHSFDQLRPLYSRRFGIEAPTWAHQTPAQVPLPATVPEPADEPDPGQTVPAVLLLNGAAARERGPGDKPPGPNG